MQHARDRIREHPERRMMLRPVKLIMEDVNAFLPGWAAYLQFGNSAHQFDQISSRMSIGGGPSSPQTFPGLAGQAECWR
ncbi:group II intron maturase-specific domain-containing protein [Streptomyces sp. NPDC002553]|uniref:group II intron maturase-specific domain-containing protein n=1 Tax=Streptomyces sp. NPDC002553 TaxID=3154417 RepID=UPI00331C1D06